VKGCQCKKALALAAFLGENHEKADSGSSGLPAWPQIGARTRLFQRGKGIATPERPVEI